MFCYCVVQASEMAQFVQAKRDLGCKAPQVTVLEEGINTDSRWAREFWSLLGGQTKYRGSYAHTSIIYNYVSPYMLTYSNCSLYVSVFVGAGEPEEDELYESGILDSNGVYRLQGDKLVPHEDAWASIPSVSMLDSKEVTPLPEPVWKKHMMDHIHNNPDSVSVVFVL